MINDLARGQSNLKEKKTLMAGFCAEAPKIDGDFSEDCWNTAFFSSDFTELSPNPGRKASFKTEVAVLYGSESVFFAAKMYDPSPDSILRQLSVRDESWNVNADNFTIFLDALYTQQSYFSFGVTAAGVQIDENDGDDLWDAVWKSAVKILEDGWQVEIEIPYSQLRFPKAAVQQWGINFGREVRRTRQVFTWSAIDPSLGNEVQQQGLLNGIENIKPPIRLSLTPYLATYLNQSYDGTTKTNSWLPNFSAGADVKYGINESFTLDVSLVPDFGDVQSDNLVFNISPFEVYYEERRPFFTEGVDLFSRADLFYSRRIGSTPEHFDLVQDQLGPDESIQSNPLRPYLINALKISGRTKSGTGLGLFNALTAPSFAKIYDDSNGTTRDYNTESFTNYNVVVFDQQFWTHSYFSLINTSVLRFGDFTDAVVTGTEFKIADKKNNYGVTGSAALSQRFQDTLLYTQSYKNGYRYNVMFEKFSGNFRFSLGQSAMSRFYDNNDLGFVVRNNFVKTSANLSYNIFNPVGLMLRMWSRLELTHEMLYNPNNFTRIQINANWGTTLKNFLTIGVDASVEPIGYDDYFEPRVYGRYWSKPTWTRLNFWFSSDYRKVLALDGFINYRRFWGTGAWANSDVLSFNIEPIMRFSDFFNMTCGANFTYRRNSIGFVTFAQSNGIQDIIFGSRYRQDIESNITANYLFNNKMALSFRLRHYWAIVDYAKLYLLGEAGQMLDTNYKGEHDANYNAFNIDLIFRWRFAPGSELNVVWKQAILNYGNQPEYDYFNNLSGMFESGLNNQFSIKALYFLDCYRLFKKKIKTK